MEIRILGHACVVLEAANGERLLIDPYESGALGGAIAYAPIEDRVDAVVCSHDHVDHHAVHALPGSPHHMIGSSARWGPFTVRRVSVAHDEYDGRRRGGYVDMLCIEVDGWRILHASDVGQAPTPQLMRRCGEVDVALVPVGGFFTIGAAQAREWSRRLGATWVIPTHYRTEGCGLEQMRGVDGFYAQWPAPHRLDSAAFRVNVLREDGVWVVPMEHAPTSNRD